LCCKAFHSNLSNLSICRDFAKTLCRNHQAICPTICHDLSICRISPEEERDRGAHLKRTISLAVARLTRHNHTLRCSLSRVRREMGREEAPSPPQARYPPTGVGRSSSAPFIWDTSNNYSHSPHESFVKLDNLAMAIVLVLCKTIAINADIMLIKLVRM
jgi:hypothetical protein